MVNTREELRKKFEHEKFSDLTSNKYITDQILCGYINMPYEEKGRATWDILCNAKHPNPMFVTRLKNASNMMLGKASFSEIYGKMVWDSLGPIREGKFCLPGLVVSDEEKNSIAMIDCLMWDPNTGSLYPVFVFDTTLDVDDMGGLEKNLYVEAVYFNTVILIDKVLNSELSVMYPIMIVRNNNEFLIYTMSLLFDRMNYVRTIRKEIKAIMDKPEKQKPKNGSILDFLFI